MRLASVSPVLKSDHWIVQPAPITCVTAIASPSARPRPRITAAAIPGRDEERTTPLTISQRVAPSASAPSSSSRGTLRNSSRQTLATIGTTMIASTSPAMKMPLDCGVPLKSGMKPSVSCSHGSRWFAANGPSTRIPQSPSTTLGTAASVSTSAPTMPPTPRGASSLRKSAIAIASGTAITSAISEVTAVPKRPGSAP